MQIFTYELRRYLSAGPLQPVNVEDHIAVAVGKGAPREDLQASVAEFGTSSTRAVINLVRCGSDPVPCTKTYTV